MSDKAFTITTEVSYLGNSDSGYVQLHVDTYATGDIEGFASDFIPGTCHSTADTKTSSIACETTIIGQGTATFTFLYEKGDSYTMTTLMHHTPQRKCRLMHTQWIGT